jgi:transposase
MFGRPESQSQIYFAIDIESWIEPDHPLRDVKKRVDEILRSMRPKFKKAYSSIGRPSVPPEMLLKALLVQSLYSIRSERQLVADIRVNLLYRWFLDLSLDAPVWDATTFTKNRERFQKHGLLRAFFDRVVEGAYVERLMSEEHFAVDGTLIQSYASMKSVRPIGTRDRAVSDSAEDDDPGNPTVNFRGEKRSNRTHRSLTDPEARLARKAYGQPAVLAHALHVLTENRHGLIVDLELTEANGFAEREAALTMIRRTKRRRKRMRTVAGDRGYDAGDFLLGVEAAGVKPMVAIRAGKIRSRDAAADARMRARRRQRTKMYAVSQRKRKLTEESFGWSKTTGGLRRSRHAERWKLGQQSLITGAAYNLLRIVRLVSRATCL